MPRKKGDRKDRFETASGIELPLAGTADLLAKAGPPHDAHRDEGFPGEYPFTRGVMPTMYRGRLWTMRQYAGFGTASETNKRFRYLLDQGQTGLSVAFDLPTQLGYDSDHGLSAGEVGKVGVAIDSLDDMERLFDGIPLDRVSTSMTINATAAILLAMYVAVARKQGVAPEKIAGTVQNDVLKEYVARGNYIYPAGPSLAIAAEIIAWCAKNVPRWNPISISGYHIREAGSTAVQEVAFTMANAIAYVDAALATGLKLEAFCGRLSFFFNASSEFLEEVAKYRAARRMWARLVVERYGAADPALGRLRFHTQTSGASLTAQQPRNNLVRVTLQALAAVLGGTQSLHTNAFDEALALPTRQAALLALRTQQILAEESGAANTIDPLAGSHTVEWLTDEIERRANGYIDKIDAMGGAVRAIETGFMQKEIHESAFRAQKAIESGERIVVGVNRFRTEEDHAPQIHVVPPDLEVRQAQRAVDVRAKRDAAAAERALDGVQQAAARIAARLDSAGGKGGASDGSGDAPPGALVEMILEAVEARATVGEISDRMRAVFGEYRETFAL